MSLGCTAIPVLLIALISPQILSVFQEQFAINWLVSSINIKYPQTCDSLVIIVIITIITLAGISG